MELLLIYLKDVKVKSLKISPVVDAAAAAGAGSGNFFRSNDQAFSSRIPSLHNFNSLFTEMKSLTDLAFFPNPQFEDHEVMMQYPPSLRKLTID